MKEVKIYYKDKKRESNIQLFKGDNLDVMSELDIDWSKTIIVTDPPFNIKYHYSTYEDNKEETDYYEWLDDILSYTSKKVVIHYPEQQFKLSYQMGLFPEKLVSWVYNANTPRQHRTITYYGVKPDFNNVQQEYKNKNDKRIRERMKRGIMGGRMYDWWFVQQVKNVSKEKTDHPAQMPLEVMKRIIATLPEGYTILDPFMGSGTTGAACQELGYDFIGIELDEKYYNIAKERLLMEEVKEE